jgi:hypothetical protein
MKMFGTAVALTLSYACCAPAGAVVLNFDDLETVGLPAIPNGYGGLNWDNFRTLDGLSTGGGYPAATVSANNVAFNGGGGIATISSSTNFFLTSAYLTAAWYDNLSVQVYGYENGALVYSQLFNPSATAPTLISFNHALINSAVFTSFGGTQHASYTTGGGFHFALDNLAINEGASNPGSSGAVPEPASWAMLVAGFGLAGGALRRRRKYTQKKAVSFA